MPKIVDFEGSHVGGSKLQTQGFQGTKPAFETKEPFSGP